MSEDLRVLLAVGTRLAYDSQWWQVAELGPHVLLASPAGVRRVSCAPARRSLHQAERRSGGPCRGGRCGSGGTNA